MRFFHSIIVGFTIGIQIVNIPLGRRYFIARATPHFTQLEERGIWRNILNTVVENEHRKQGREDTQDLLAIDSQNVKKVQFTNEETGIDGSKNVSGKKEL